MEAIWLPEEGSDDKQGRLASATVILIRIVVNDTNDGCLLRIEPL